MKRKYKLKHTGIFHSLTVKHLNLNVIENNNKYYIY